MNLPKHMMVINHIFSSIKTFRPVFASSAKLSFHQYSSLASTTKTHYDIIVAGGGMVGTTLACTLGKNKQLSNKEILLLEGSPEKEWTIPEKYSNRVSSLNSGTYQLLNKIDAWKHIEGIRYNAVKGLQVWDAMSDTTITFDNDSLNGPVVYVVENDVLLAAVSKELRALNNVKVVHQAKIKDCSYAEKESLVSIILNDGTSYTCNLLLGCDGANSQVRKSVGIHYLSWNYNHMGLVATLTMQEDFENTTAWQRHLPNGEVVAFLPLSKSLSSLVWCLTSQRARDLVAIPEEQFISELNNTVTKDFSTRGLVDQATKAADSLARYMNLPSSSSRQIFPKVVNCESNSRACFPLGFGHATNYVGKGIALVGDAAHRIHPLAGQGVNLGFGDITCLNQLLSDAAYTGSKIDNMHFLKQYETQRQKHNMSTMLAVDGLFRIFNTQFAPVVLLRGVGIQAIHALKPIKKLLMAQASA